MEERTIRTTFLVLIGLILGAFAVSACDFTFNYDEITAPVGTVGEIGVRVQKTHDNCTMTDQLDYQFAWENLQVIGETPWEEVGPQLYEKWFKVSLSALGEGFLKISKTCSKEGYEEAILTVTVTEGAADGAFLQSLSGTYPFEVETDLSIKTVVGAVHLAEELLTIDDLQVSLPTIPIGLEDYLGEARLYYTQVGSEQSRSFW